MDLDKVKPWMTDEQIRVLESHLTNDTVLLEWGCGYSTVYFSQRVKMVISIEHDREWSERVIRMVSDSGISNVNVTLIPKNMDYANITDQMKRYIEFPDTLGITPDVVLIDGRCRRRCAMDALKFIKPETVVFIHDFNREYYHPVLDYYDVIEITTDVTGIVALKMKNKNG